MIASLFIILSMLFLFLSVIALIFELSSYFIEKNKNIKWKKSLLCFIVYIILLVIGLIIVNI